MLVGSLLGTSIAAAGEDGDSGPPSTAPAAPDASEFPAPPGAPEEAAEAPAAPVPVAAAHTPEPELPRAPSSRFDEEAAQLPAATPREWYGLPMLVFDGLWLGTIALGRAAHSDEFVIVATVGGITNGMFVHLYAYDSSFAGLGVGLLSVALRGALAGGGCALGSGCSELSDGALLRTSIGIAIGAGLDAAFLAYKPLFRPRSPTGVGFAPLLSPDTVGGSVVGRF
jgi:hypothetical protein